MTAPLDHSRHGVITDSVLILLHKDFAGIGQCGEETAAVLKNMPYALVFRDNDHFGFLAWGEHSSPPAHCGCPGQPL